VRGVPGLGLDDGPHRLGEEMSVFEERLVEGDHEEDELGTMS
jgi:hypothetical protein